MTQFIFRRGATACLHQLCWKHCGQVARINLSRFYYTYVLISRKDGKLYIGWSEDLKLRVEQHNKGKVEATKSRIPLELIYYEACLSSEDAIKREKSLKTGFGRKYLKRRIRE